MPLSRGLCISGLIQQVLLFFVLWGLKAVIKGLRDARDQSSALKELWLNSHANASGVSRGFMIQFNVTAMHSVGALSTFGDLNVAQHAWPLRFSVVPLNTAIRWIDPACQCYASIT